MKLASVLGVKITNVLFTPTAKMRMFVGTCLYVHRRSTDGSVFYVGIGSRNRARSTHGRGPGWDAVYFNYGREVEVVQVFSDAKHAAAREVELIDALRSAGVELVNVRPGGEGVTRYKTTVGEAYAAAVRIQQGRDRRRLLDQAIARWRRDELLPYLARLGLLPKRRRQPARTA